STDDPTSENSGADIPEQHDRNTNLQSQFSQRQTAGSERVEVFHWIQSKAIRIPIIRYDRVCTLQDFLFSWTFLQNFRVDILYIRVLARKDGTSAQSKVVAYIERTATFPGVVAYIIDELRPVPSARACSSCFIPDPTSLRSVRSSIFYSMLHPRPNLTSFG
ncbi:hypothetical protein E4T56_gene14242, partial [Termitomyces sp. T112]